MFPLLASLNLVVFRLWRAVSIFHIVFNFSRQQSPWKVTCTARWVCICGGEQWKPKKTQVVPQHDNALRSSFCFVGDFKVGFKARVLDAESLYHTGLGRVITEHQHQSALDIYLTCYGMLQRITLVFREKQGFQQFISCNHNEFIDTS